ncbi:GTF2H2 [Symbiodinium sp. CCMP2592]|nr:GTF2H2 [Symbiodinium sp. CCMP2592]
MDTAVDDIAEEEGGIDEDRAQNRAARSLEARWRWESLLEDGAIGRAPPPAARPAAPKMAAPVSEAEETALRRGVIRYVYLAVDMTATAARTDIRPRRLDFLCQAATRFSARFLAENPLSEIGLLVLRDGKCQALAPLGTAPATLRSCLATAAQEGPSGRTAAVAALQRAAEGLGGAPPHGSRELLMLFTSVSTCNLQDLSMEDVGRTLRERKVQVSVVSLSPEIYMLKRVCVDTFGRFDVAMNTKHFEDLLSSHLSAPACTAGQLAPKLVRMGFPKMLRPEAKKQPETCTCHLEVHGTLYVCPRCSARSCGLPSRCKICDLPLVSASVLARAFRSVVPLPAFSEGLPATSCGACLLPIHSSGRQCPSCKASFCQACDDFMHTTLRQCPSCLAHGGAARLSRE